MKILRILSSVLRRATSAHPSARRRSAFTLIELLIVVTIMAMLLALLGGGIRKSIENARKRQRATEVQTLQSAIMTYWHDTGKPPISTKKGTYTYKFTKDNDEVFARLIDAGHKENQLGKAYLDMNQLRTADSDGHARPMKKATEPVADPFGKFYKVTIDMETKNAEVGYQ